MKLGYKTSVLMLLLIHLGLNGQNQATQTRTSQDEVKQGWVNELHIGVDFLSNLLINPTVGGGNNNLGFGASFELNNVYNSGRFSWENSLNLQYGIQKSGSGVLEDNPSKKVPFQKNIDNIWLNSKMALRTSYFSKFYFTTDLFFSSQLTPTYEDNYLSDVTGTGAPIAKFLSPGLLQFAVGMDYRANDYFSIFFSPLSYRVTIVNDENIADDIALDSEGDFLGTIHGNPFEINQDDSITLKKYDNQLGATMRMVYNNQVSERLALSSNLLLFSNYVRSPDHIDVNWRNTIDFTLFKNLKLSLLSLLSYDHDVLVQITDNDTPGGLNGLGRRVSYTQQLVVKYTFTFE